MIIYHENFSVITEIEYQALPENLPELSVTSLQELRENLLSALEISWLAGNNMQALAIDEDIETVDKYIKMQEKREGKTMERKCKAIIKKTSFPLDNCLNYDVQLWYEWHAGKNDFVYAGYGRYFADKKSAMKYAAENATIIIDRTEGQQND